MQRPWPEAIDDLIGSPGVPAERRSPDRWTLGRVTVWRTGEADGDQRLLDRLAAAASFAVPQVRGRVGAWLVSELAGGERADRPERHAEPGSLARAVGSGLAALHGLPVGVLETDAAVPPDRWATVIERCRQRVAAGLVDTGRLPEPYARYDAERLLEMFEGTGNGQAGAAPPDPPVLCHGRPTLDRVLVDGGRFVGFDGFESAVVADRHLDLAVAHRSIAEVLGAEAVVGLYEGYGFDPDLIRLDRAVLASHLLGVETDPLPAR